MIPRLLISPTVGFMPTNELAVAGFKIEPEVSVPIATAAMAAAQPAPEPEEEPAGLITPGL